MQGFALNGHSALAEGNLNASGACVLVLARLAIFSLALDILAWLPMLALTGTTRCWEPEKLRLHLEQCNQALT
ncbi:hypothetical protein ACFV2I_36990 [Streptomyces microflavus]|uniref:hypothetical protein n=1 Tax=Streptomyces microflavus TaxID=1919 RepID=UPI00368FFF79